jgi:hypothetical protein
VGTRGGAVGWVRFLMVSLEFFIDNLSGRTMALGLTQPLTEMSTRNISLEVKAAVRRADNLTTFTCRVSWNMGASTSWNPLGQSRPLIAFPYISRYVHENTAEIIGYTYSFCIRCANSTLPACRQKYCRNCPHHTTGWRGLTTGQLTPGYTHSRTSVISYDITGWRKSQLTLYVQRQ